MEASLGSRTLGSAQTRVRTLGSERPHRVGNFFGLEAGDLEPLRRLCNFATTLGASGFARLVAKRRRRCDRSGNRVGNFFRLEVGDLEPLRRLCNFATTLGASGWQLQAKLQDGKAV